MDKFINFIKSKFGKFRLLKKIDDDSYEFKPILVEIEDHPQNPLGRTIVYIVTLSLIFFVLWNILAKVDIVVSASGKVIPNGEIKILKPLENGIVSKILVKEGQKVKAGEALILVDPSVSSVNLQTHKENLAALLSAIARLVALSKEEQIKFEINKDERELYENQKISFYESIDTYNLKIKQLQNQILASKEDLKRLNSLCEFSSSRLNNLEKVKDIIAKKEYDEARKEFSDYSSQVSIAQQRLNETNNKLSEIQKELESFKSTSKSKWLDELLAKQKEASAIKADINAISFQSKVQIISSPVDGYVGKLLINTQGSAINAGEALISIIPSDENLIIKANVLNKDIGFLELHQKVAIKIDTFNFQKYGKLDGELIHISNDSIKDEKLGEIYEIKVNPLQNSLLIDGQEKPIEPGMSVVAEIKVGKRRVIELFIYPIIRYLDEGLSVR